MAAQTVVQMQDRRRVLIVAAPAGDDPRLRAQRRALAAWGEGAAERDVSVVELVGRVVSGAADEAAALRARYHLSPTGFAVVLIGKDGGVKKVWREPVDPKDMFTIIDSMPMRQREMRG